MNLAVPIKRTFAGASSQELARRRDALAAHLRRQGLDALVILGTDHILSGAVRWLTNAPVAYRRVVLFYPNDPMTVIEHGAMGERRTMDDTTADYPGVGEVFTVAQFPSAHYGQRYEAEVAVAALRHRNCKRIGLVNPGGMPHAFVVHLKDGVAGATFTDESDAVDTLRAVKSAEELSLLRQAAEIQDQIFDNVLAKIEPGITDADVAGMVAAQSRKLGGEAGFIGVGSAPVGVASPFQLEYRQARTIQAGDHLSLLIETCGPGGYFVELSRTIVLGRANSELQEAFDAVQEAQRRTLARCKPGVSCRELFEAHNLHMAERGLPLEKRLFGHGQGYDMVERPLFRDDETMSLKEGMCIVVHPAMMTESCYMTLTDNYIVEADGVGPSIHRTPQKIFEI